MPRLAPDRDDMYQVRLLLLQNRPMIRLRLAFLLFALSACGDNATPGLDEYLPDIPEPTGDTQSVFAGVIDDGNAADELIPGEAAHGMVGDLYLRNARGRYVIQSAGRVIGVVPQGGNLVDAQPIGPDGPIGTDQFGELSSMYIFGRTCEHNSVEVVQDGSGGGAAAIRARGVSGINDWINLRGLGVINVPADLDPVIPDEIECATTYILQPDSDTVEVYWTFYNAGERAVSGPFAAFSDMGGETEAWSHRRGYEKLGVESLTDPNLGPSPTEYSVFQAPGVAYGVVPQHAEEVPLKTNASIQITGVSIMLFGADEIFDILRAEGIYFDLEGGAGVTHAVRFITGQDAADVEASLRAAQGVATHELSGKVTWASGDPAPARVGVFREDDDTVVTYADTDADGAWSARLVPGDYVVRADVLERGRSESVAVALAGDETLDLEVPDPVRVDYTVVDDATDEPIPARLSVIGATQVATDARLFSTYDTFAEVASVVLAPHGSSIENADGADPAIYLPAGGDYRVVATRGTEWSVASTRVTPEPGDPDQEIELRLRRVIETGGYVSSEYHVHSIGSFDSPVAWATRVATAAVDGIELFASTEHDYVADLQPIAEALGLERVVRVLVGSEVTPFAYGHFNIWPLERADDDPSGGAIDWARGPDGFALVPGEIFDRARERGAELVQVNHPRAAPGSPFDLLAYFDRAGLTFDYEERAILGDSAQQSLPNDWLRLPPGETLLDLDFNALEVWGDVEIRDWFNFLTLGFVVTPLGNSDTHTVVKNPMGFPRSYVRVDDDSPDALEDGSIVGSLLDTLSGRAARDVVVTNGPHVSVTEQGDTDSVIGATVEGDGTVTLTIDVQSPRWAHFDTIEVFANATPDSDAEDTTQFPAACFTTTPEADLAEDDPCALAPLGVQLLDVQEVPVVEGFTRYEATVDVTLASDQPIYPDGATGEDMWVVVRVRGHRGIYPLLLGVLSGDNLATFVAGVQSEIDELLDGSGTSALAFTAPIFLDLDGGGYRAVLGPE